MFFAIEDKGERYALVASFLKAMPEQVLYLCRSVLPTFL